MGQDEEILFLLLYSGSRSHRGSTCPHSIGLLISNRTACIMSSKNGDAAGSPLFVAIF